ncbi:MAG: hypothetical protein ACRERD_21995, partial [Candidatus Binatia bacterium]
GPAQCDATPGTPTQEVCNGIDDDCDGSADEDVSQMVTCGLGACERTVQTCVNGQPQMCVPGDPPMPEEQEDGSFGGSCSDGIDDDCDGLTDCEDPACDGTPDCFG